MPTKGKLFFVENLGGVDGPPTCKDMTTYLIDIVYPIPF
jgi:hypothetical protein